MVRLAGWLGLLMLSVAAATGSALAHETKLSSSRLTIDGNQIVAQIEVNAVDLNVATGATLTSADGTVDPRELSRQLDVVRGYVAEHVRLINTEDGQCDSAWGAATPKQDHVVLQRRWECPADAVLAYRVTLFHDIDPASRHMVSVAGERKFIGLLSVQTPQMALTQAIPSKWQTGVRYLVSGIEHIAIGYDHIAFLIAVIVLGRRFWPLFKVITAFTVAHSITLSLAVLEIATLPSRLVETLIAATIVYVAAENFFVRDIRHRWWLTFTFGLIHGFGFASVLRDYGLPEDALALALAAFNVGVEIGQLFIVLLAAVVWQAGFRAAASLGMAVTEARERRVSLAVSAAVLAAGLYWLAQRLFLG